jgi:hypothetical protein
MALERRFFEDRHTNQADSLNLRIGFFVLVVGSILAEVFALMAMASRARWIEVVSTILAAVTIPSMLVLITGAVFVSLYRPAASDAVRAE